MRSAEDEARRRGFSDALHRARLSSREEEARVDPAALHRRESPGARRARLPSSSTASDARAASVAEGEVRPAAAARKEGARPEQPIAPEIASLARALPPAAFAAASAAGGAPLVLSFGRALDVELRCGPSGIELVLRPSARLFAATQRELPPLVAALAARGITVSRAEIRGRTAAPRRGRAR